MRFRTGFAPGDLPELATLFLDLPDAESPVASAVFRTGRRFSCLAEPGSVGGDDLFPASPAPVSSVSSEVSAASVSSTLVIAGAGTRRDALEALCRTGAGLVLAEPAVTGLPPSSGHLPIVRIRDARAALAAILHACAADIHRPTPFATGAGNRVHPTAVVEGVLEGDVTVEAGAVIAAGAFIGRGARIEANAVIREHVWVGANTVVQSGVVVGVTGFGFFGTSTGLAPMPHRAGVIVGADCFLGANTVVAAGVIHPTTLGRGCKLDSHVQIAHNVRLGDGALMASQSGIAGSTVAGRNLRMGGAASVAGHLRLGDAVSVAAKAGVTKDVPDGMTVAGFPARPIAQWRRDVAASRAGANRKG